MNWDRTEIVNRFQNFRKTFNGNPKEEVDRLVKSGQISQAQLNDLQRKADELKKIFGM